MPQLTEDGRESSQSSALIFYADCGAALLRVYLSCYYEFPIFVRNTGPRAGLDPDRRRCRHGPLYQLDCLVRTYHPGWLAGSR